MVNRLETQALIHALRFVHSQESHRCPTGWRAADDGSPLKLEVRLPLLPPRVKKRHNSAAYRIDSRQIATFTEVATSTGQRQIVLARLCFMSDGDDVSI